MFTWICPQCGREVPPAYNECPDCTGKQAAQPAAQTGPQPGPQAATIAAPPAAAPQPQRYAPPPAPSGITLPPWLMSIVFAILFLVVGAGAYFGIKHFSGSSASAGTQAPLETATPASKAKASSLQKYLEVVGLRLSEENNKKPQVHFIVVNHSGAEIADLAANVNLWARTAKSDEEAVGTFTFKIPSLGAYESKDMTAPLNTKLRVYELPDWQNLTAEIQITSPE